MPGVEWLIESHGCDPAALREVERLQRLFDRIIAELGLTAIGAPLWHTFPPPGGVTGLVVLAESHLACHSFPEFASICVNVFCCRPVRDWNVSDVMSSMVGATATDVRRLERDYQGQAALLARGGGDR